VAALGLRTRPRSLVAGRKHLVLAARFDLLRSEQCVTFLNDKSQVRRVDQEEDRQLLALVLSFAFTTPR
jgi:hypothetical protein